MVSNEHSPTLSSRKPTECSESLLSTPLEIEQNPPKSYNCEWNYYYGIYIWAILWMTVTIIQIYIYVQLWHIIHVIKDVK